MAVIAARVAGLCDIDEIPTVTNLMSSVPLPLPMFYVETNYPLNQVRADDQVSSTASVAFTSFLLDGSRFEDPQTVMPEVLHDLTVEASVSRWPDTSKQLMLEPLSVEPIGTYELPSFTFDRPTGAPPYSVIGTRRMLVKCPTSFFARPLEFAYRARFAPSDASVLIQGQRHLRAQCFDPTRNPQSGYVQIDLKLQEIRNAVRRVPAIMDSELNNLLILLSAVGGIAGQALQDDLFPGKWSEKQFQSDMKSRLRGRPEIGSQLEEHPHAAGGITDLSFRAIRLELKVEADRFVSIEDARRFLQQTAQYVAGSDRRLGVLCILDCSDKSEAPGSPANDLFLETLTLPTAPCRSASRSLSSVAISESQARSRTAARSQLVALSRIAPRGQRSNTSSAIRLRR